MHDGLKALEWIPKITSQWNVKNYNDPWQSDHNHRTYLERKKAGTLRIKKYKVYIFDVTTNIYSISDNLTECSKLIKINAKSIRQAIKNNRSISGRYYVAKNTKQLIENMKKPLSNNNAPQPIKCIDMHTGIMLQFNSRTEAAKILKCNRESVRYGHLYKKRYKFMEVNE